MDTAARWRLTLLGSLKAEPLAGDSAPLTQFRTQKTALLLAYLALHPGPQPREVLIALLWPDAAPEAARNSLSVALSSLRHQLEPPGTPAGSALTADRQTIGLREGVLAVDVAAFLGAERQGRTEEAARLYTGPLLVGFWDDWVLAERDRLAGIYAAVVRRLLASLPADQALRWRHHAARADPDHADLYDQPAGAPPIGAPPAERASETRTVTVVAVDPAAPEPSALDSALRHHGGAPAGERIWSFASAGDATGFAAACVRLSEGKCAAALWTSEVPGAGKRLGTPAADATRLLAFVRPGHLVCGEPTAALLRAARDPGLEIRALGAGRTADDREPEPLFAIVPAGSAPDGAALQGLLSAAPATLPAYPTRFFGRERERAQLIERLADGPLVTLLGPGGTGKTRLVVETLRRLAAQGQSVCFVPLAERTDPSSLWGAVRLALRLPPQGDPRDQVRQALTDRPLVLALDNAEHLLESVATLVAELLESAPALRLLVTSRRALGVPGERLFPLEPLPLPGDEPDPARLLAASPAVALFCDRARAALPDFQLTPRNAATVAALCRRLDGLPLALELTASRARVLTPGQWLERLERGLDAVAVSARAGVPERHRSLTAALRWSYDLLPPETRAFFPKLALFRGGWDLDAAEAITDEPLALDRLAALAEDALIQSEEAGETIRFRQLELIREFADALLPTDERAILAERHAAFYADLARTAGGHLGGPEQARWLERLEREHENLRAALERSLRVAPNRALELAGDLAPFWERHGHYDEGRRLLAQALDAAGEADPAVRASAVGGAWSLAMCQADFPAARRLAQEERTLRQALGEPLGIARALHRLAGVELRQGRYDEAEALLRESLTLKQAHGAPPRERAVTLINLGVIANERGDCAAGARFFTESLACTREAGATHLTAMILNNLGVSTEELGDLDAALGHFTESLTLKQSLGDRRGTAITLQNAARVLRRRGDAAGARERLLESLRLLVELGDPANAAITLFGLGALAAELEDRPLHAARLWGCWSSLTDALQTPLAPLYRQSTEDQIARARAACGDEQEFAAAWDTGRSADWRTLARELMSPPT